LNQEKWIQVLQSQLGLQKPGQNNSGLGVNPKTGKRGPPPAPQEQPAISM